MVDLRTSFTVFLRDFQTCDAAGLSWSLSSAVTSKAWKEKIYRMRSIVILLARWILLKWQEIIFPSPPQFLQFEQNLIQPEEAFCYRFVMRRPTHKRVEEATLRSSIKKLSSKHFFQAHLPLPARWTLAAITIQAEEDAFRGQSRDWEPETERLLPLLDENKWYCLTFQHIKEILSMGWFTWYTVILGKKYC